ncbi:MAG: hypothetical protein HY785_17700 [Oscillatoriophycideae cyanobacterium NC_groundwater_1537_Pr4_S-0.65um_50_18]|nr:hypothetical protein [Oscillatoriophycideae cyanobacterium NC_groundwater_1537_Pr4_S-0.65um_50_18]
MEPVKEVTGAIAGRFFETENHFYIECCRIGNDNHCHFVKQAGQLT